MQKKVEALSAELPLRAGEGPSTTPTNPHQQLDQNAPPAMQEALHGRMRALPRVVEAPSNVSVPGTRAFHLDPLEEGGPRHAFMFGREFAHLHPPDDGSLHLALPRALGEEAEEKGWGERHPFAGRFGFPGTVMMLYGPRDEGELEVVWGLVRASYEYAQGERGAQAAAPGSNRR